MFPIKSGVPFFHNYSLTEYNLQPQNWCIKQDKRGIIYIGNQGGLLEYDGSEWRIIEIPNWTVRSMAFDLNGTLFIGGKDEIGYIESSPKREPRYVSLLAQLGGEHMNFGDIWRIVRNKNDLYLWSSPIIFKWDGKKLVVWRSGLPCRGIYECRGKLYIHLKNIGLQEIIDDNIVPVPDGERFKNNKICSVLSYGENRLLIITKKEGLFLSKGNSFNKFYTEFDKYITERINGLDKIHTHPPYCGIRLSSGEYAVGTGNGVFVLNRSGNLISILDKKSGLDNSSVKVLYEDRWGNIWIGLNVGITKIEYNSPFRILDNRAGLDGMLLSLAEHEGMVYAGTSSGLFVFQNNGFSKISKATMEIWDLLSTNKGLYIASSSGILFLKEGKIFIISGDRTFKLLESLRYPSLIRAGTTKGVITINAKDNSIVQLSSGEIFTEIRTLVEDKNGVLWAGSLTQGVFKITSDKKGNIEGFRNYYVSQGLPGDETRVIFVNNRVIFGTEKGLYKFNPSKEKFEPDSMFGKKFCDGSTGVYKIFEDNNKKCWIHAGIRNFLVVKNGNNGYKISDRIYKRMPKRQVNSFLKVGKEVWFGTIDGITIFNTDYKIKFFNEHPPILRKITVNGTDEIYHGSSLNGKNTESLFTLDSNCRNIKFEYSSPFYVAENKTEFRCKLEGSGKMFSEWSDKNFMEFYNLGFGYYRLHIEAKNVYGDVSSSTIFPFKIMAPWYWRWWIFPIYLILIGGFIHFIVKWRSASLVREKKVLEKIIAERTIELREKSIKLEELDRIKSKFFENISHEFRTPLTLINGPLEDMINENKNIEDRCKLKKILKNSNKLLVLINQLLDLSKLESGHMKLKKKPDDVIGFIRGVLSAFEYPAKEKNISLSFSTQHNKLIISFDRDKLENVFSNLLANAVKFTEKGGEILIHESMLFNDRGDENYVKIVISDTGKGIPKKELGRVFDRFYQAENELEGGTGIGLALAKELIELHSGTIKVENNIPSGTVFEILLPTLEKYSKTVEINESEKLVEIFADTNSINEEQVEVDQKCEYEKISPDRKSILIIDDNSDIRRYIATTLSAEFIIREADNGYSGLSIAEEMIPDLIICDVMMPKIDGLETCRKLKNNIKTSHIPVIMLTAKAGESDQIEGLQRGADDYILKPFNSKILLSRIRNIIELRGELQLKIMRQLTLKPSEIKVTSMDTEFLNEFKTVIEENLSDPLLDIDIFTKKMFMGRSTLFRKVEGLTGVSPMQFVRSYRLQRGAQLLKQGYSTITRISMEVGFTSPAYFTKCFKEEFHKLPSEYSFSEKENG